MQKNLQLLKNELVPVYTTDKGEKVVYGTELHEVLEVKSKFADWVKNRLNDCDAVENKDFQSFSKILEKGGRPQTEYIIQLDTAKEMAMLERNAKGKQVRRYFIRIEEEYKETNTPLTLQQQIQTIAKGTDELYQRVDVVTENVKEVKQEIETLKDEFPLFPSEADEVKNAINRKVVSLFDGKDSNAYHDKSLVKKVFSDCYKNVKHNFGDINTYKAIKRGQRAQALQIISEYKPPLFLAEQITNANAQQTLDLKGGAGE